MHCIIQSSPLSSPFLRFPSSRHLSYVPSSPSAFNSRFTRFSNYFSLFNFFIIVFTPPLIHLPFFIFPLLYSKAALLSAVHTSAQEIYLFMSSPLILFYFTLFKTFLNFLTLLLIYLSHTFQNLYAPL